MFNPSTIKEKCQGKDQKVLKVEINDKTVEKTTKTDSGSNAIVIIGLQYT